MCITPESNTFAFRIVFGDFDGDGVRDTPRARGNI